MDQYTWVTSARPRSDEQFTPDALNELIDRIKEMRRPNVSWSYYTREELDKYDELITWATRNFASHTKDLASSSDELRKAAMLPKPQMSFDELTGW